MRKIPPKAVLSEHVLNDILAQKAAQQPQPPGRRYTIHCGRWTCFASFVLFGWSIAIYPFWLFDTRFIKPFDFRWHSPQNFDCTLALGLFALDFSPFHKPKKPAAESRIA